MAPERQHVGAIGVPGVGAEVLPQPPRDQIPHSWGDLGLDPPTCRPVLRLKAGRSGLRNSRPSGRGGSEPGHKLPYLWAFSGVNTDRNLPIPGRLATEQRHACVRVTWKGKSRGK